MSNPVEQYMPQAPARIGQGTAVEQSRAVAEVQAAIVVAQQCPRNLSAAVAEMRQSCQNYTLAQRSTFRFSRGSGTVNGPSIHLARELARCWGNIQYGLTELRRDDAAGESEMQAWAWDVQTNTRNSSTFIVPHKRDTKDGARVLTDMRDIYENNANNGARRVREAIFAVLPAWYIEEAKTLCAQALKNGGGQPLAQRIADARAAYEAVGVTVDQLEQKVTRPVDKWTDHDVAQLQVIYNSIDRGEVTRDEEFPPPRVTAEEIAEASQPTTGPAAWPQVVQPGGAE
ncbi:hypothetical protein RMN57_12980 [Kitasatospora sp. CM 4170]|uniref:Uncharacterized protein n=1 Tax=Kitasatospora aburaviensis TaxID=67265 RepID=A0ABW1F3L5_9ACTN|nr:hypothetical protein [Kitasatospora sp. CM 4170]WNM45567.1 hypothetical protein RMN57_12980 [Kitasatospora sp. CM 4170]